MPIHHIHKTNTQNTEDLHITKLRECLLHLLTVLNKHDVPYWLDFGTLLGSIREHNIIPWDADADISILRSDFPKVAAILPEILQLGQYPMTDRKVMWCCEVFWDGTIKLCIHKCTKHIDIYPWEIHEEEGLAKHPRPYFGYPTFPLHEIESFETIDFCGVPATIPSNYKERLTRLYGDDYMTPKQITYPWNNQ